MNNYLWEQYRAGTLPHALLLEAGPFTTQELVSDFANEAGLTATDLYQLPIDDSLKVIQIRELIHFANLSSMGSKPKFIVIADATRLTIEAANALLKTLEEPPRDTYFILAAQRLDAILPTIRSRCRTVSIKTSPTERTAITTPLPFPQPSLSAYFNLSKELAAGDHSPQELLNSWLIQLAGKEPSAKIYRYQKLLLKYQELGQNNPNKRLFLDNLFLEAYNTDEDRKDIS